MGKTVILSILLLIFSSVFVQARETKSIRVFGDKAMASMINKWGKLFEKENPDVGVVVIGTSTPKGYSSILEGIADIAMVTKSPSEKITKLAKAKKAEFKRQRIGWGAIVIVANSDVGVTELSIKQLQDIYTKKVINWSELGGKDSPIMVNALDPKIHGVGIWFKNRIVKEELNPGFHLLDQHLHH